MPTMSFTRGKSDVFVGDFAATVEFDPAKMTLNGEVVSAAAIAYGIQRGVGDCLRDSYAGAKNATEAKTKFAAKLAEIIDGTLPEYGTSGPRVTDPFEATCRKVAYERIAQHYKENGLTGKKLPKPEETFKTFTKNMANAEFKKEVEDEARRRLKAVPKIKITL